MVNYSTIPCPIYLMEFVRKQTKGGFKTAQEGAIIRHIQHMEEDSLQRELGFNNAWEPSIIQHFELSDINPLFVQDK